jgi:long-chain acyl-CoA synthetase
MMGYYKDEKLTSILLTDSSIQEILDFDDQGFLKITDRKKKCSKPQEENIAPQLVKIQWKQSRFIEQIMVIGDGQKCQQLYSAKF